MAMASSHRTCKKSKKEIQTKDAKMFISRHVVDFCSCKFLKVSIDV